MGFIHILFGASILTLLYFFLCAAILGVYGSLAGSINDHGLRTITVACLVFFIAMCGELSTTTPHGEYLKIKSELESLQELAVKAGIGHFKEVAVEIKREFIIGSFTAEVEPDEQPKGVTP